MINIDVFISHITLNNLICAFSSSAKQTLLNNN